MEWHVYPHTFASESFHYKNQTHHNSHDIAAKRTLSSHQHLTCPSHDISATNVHWVLNNNPSLILFKVHTEPSTIAWFNILYYCFLPNYIAGSTEYLKYTTWLMADACRLQVSKNETLFRSNSSSRGPSVVDILQNQLCQSNCSNNGYCNMSMYDTV